MLTYLGNFARTGDPNTAIQGGTDSGLALPKWAQHTPRAERLMTLRSVGVGVEMRPLASDVVSRFLLLAGEYFTKVVPRQLAQGQRAPDSQQVTRRGGWTGRRRQRL